MGAGGIIIKRLLLIKSKWVILRVFSMVVGVSVSATFVPFLLGSRSINGYQYLVPMAAFSHLRIPFFPHVTRNPLNYRNTTDIPFTP
jgi:hypothetical protein